MRRGPRGARCQDAREVRRVGAVDHVVGGRVPGHGVDLLDRLPQARAVRQPAVGLDRERDRDRHAGGPRGTGHADRLVRVGHRDRRHHVGVGIAEGLRLLPMVVLCGVRAHEALGVVAVAARARCSRSPPWASSPTRARRGSRGAARSRGDWRRGARRSRSRAWRPNRRSPATWRSRGRSRRPARARGRRRRRSTSGARPPRPSPSGDGTPRSRAARALRER